MLTHFISQHEKNLPYCILNFIKFCYNCIVHSKVHLISTGEILAVFWRLTEGVAVSVDSGEQYRPRGPAQTVAFSQ